MIDQNKLTLFSLKSFLFVVALVFATAAALLLLWLTSAATVMGEAPASAVALVEGVNTGVLGPGEQRWFRFRPGQGAGLEQSLTLVFAPDENKPTNPVAFQLFDESQVPFFYQGDASKMANLGAGQIITRDNNPATGELVWTGWLAEQKSYYVQVMNGSAIVIDYWLFNQDAVPPAFNLEAAPAPAPVFAPGAAPSAALPLSLIDNQGGLEPGREIWYSFTTADSDGDKWEPVALTMIATPDDGHRIQSMTFDIYPAGAVKNWSSAGSASMNNMGAGSLVYRDNNPWTGERFWTGWVLEGDLYYVRLRNGADVRMDYWLFAGDVYGPELGESGRPAP